MSDVFVATAYGADQECNEIYRNPDGEYVLTWRDEDGGVARQEFVPGRRVLYYRYIDEESDSSDE